MSLVLDGDVVQDVEQITVYGSIVFDGAWEGNVNNLVIVNADH